MARPDLVRVLTLRGERMEQVFADQSGVLHIAPDQSDYDERKRQYPAYIDMCRSGRGWFSRLRRAFHVFQGRLYAPDRSRWRDAVARLTSPVPRPERYGDFLDVGCNTGVFLGSLPAPWRRFGAEINSEAAAMARLQPGVTVFEGPLEKLAVDAQFDFVRASHVIEHVPDYEAFLQRIRSLTREKGRVLLYTPNTRSISFRAFGRDWQPFYDLTHYRLFNADNLATACREAGFQILESGTYFMGISAGSLLRFLRVRPRNVLYRPLLIALIGVTFPGSLLVNRFGWGGALYMYLRPLQ